MSTTAQPPAGWYANPEAPGERYWDGTAWTSQVRQPPPPPPPAPPGYAPRAAGESAGGLVVAGWICAVLIPIVGLILGIIIACSNRPATKKHGVWVIVASIAFFGLWYAVVYNSTGTSSTF